MGNNPISSNFNEHIFAKFYEINFIYVILVLTKTEISEKDRCLDYG